MKEYRVKLAYLRISSRKVRLVADLVRGMSAEAARSALYFSTKRASSPISKLLDSAVANAKTQGASVEKLVIKEIRVDDGPILKRFRPMSRGRAFPIEKRTSHISIILFEKEEKVSSKEEPKKEAKKKPVVKKSVSTKLKARASGGAPQKAGANS
ncbi:MAG: 50S ribosomal protein L22 [Candidatus Spechtbacterales bacterium]